jgi:hypothetical protein
MAAHVTRPCLASDYAIIVGTEATGEAPVLALSDAERRVTRRLAQVPTHHGCTVERWRALALPARADSHGMTERRVPWHDGAPSSPSCLRPA